MASEPGSIHALAAAALLGVVGMNVAANVFLKMGASPDIGGFRLFGSLGWPILAGIACYATAFLVYAWSLRHVELHMAQAIVSLQFAGAIAASVLLFNEQIEPHQWVGIGLIFIGLFIVVR